MTSNSDDSIVLLRLDEGRSPADSLSKDLDLSACLCLKVKILWCYDL